jgi:hypothetical protein
MWRLTARGRFLFSEVARSLRDHMCASALPLTAAFTSLYPESARPVQPRDGRIVFYGA